MYFTHRKRVIIITKFQIELHFICTDHMTSKRNNANRYYLQKIVRATYFLPQMLLKCLKMSHRSVIPPLKEYTSIFLLKSDPSFF